MIPVGLLGKTHLAATCGSCFCSRHEKAAQCAALKVVGPHELEPWSKDLALFRRHGLLHEWQQCIGCRYQFCQQGFVHIHIAFVLSQIAAFVTERKQAYLGFAQPKGVHQTLEHQIAAV